MGQIGKVSKIESMGLLDGPGVRTVVFMQGCILRCAYCHNPSQLSLDGGTSFTASELLEKVIRYKSYYSIDGGVTVSGGEPLVQTFFLIEFFKLCKENGINTCLDTSGIGINAKQYDELLKHTDLVLLDIKHTDSLEFEKLTLVKREKINPFRESLKNAKTKVWIRQVIIPDYNDNQKYLNSLLEEIKDINNIEKIDFLPYHKLAVSLYDELGLEYRMKNTLSMDGSKCKSLEKAFIKMYEDYKLKQL